MSDCAPGVIRFLRPRHKPKSDGGNRAALSHARRSNAFAGNPKKVAKRRLQNPTPFCRVVETVEICRRAKCVQVDAGIDRAVAMLGKLVVHQALANQEPCDREAFWHVLSSMPLRIIVARSRHNIVPHRKKGASDQSHVCI